MQRSLGAGGVHQLVIAFEVAAADIRVERAVHALLKAQGRHFAAGPALEWFSIEPTEAEALVSSFAKGELSLEEVHPQATRCANLARDRSSIRGKKAMRMTPKRAAALQAVRNAVANDGSPSDFKGGEWGAAATALAVEEDISKEAALVLMREWFMGSSDIVGRSK